MYDCMNMKLKQSSTMHHAYLEGRCTSYVKKCKASRTTYY